MITRLAPGYFYGRTKSSHTCAGMTFQESAYSRALHIAPHAHAHAFFCLVLEGTSTEICGKTARINEPFTLVFHPAGEVHENHWHSSGGRTFHVEITAPTLGLLRDRAPVLDGPAHFRGSPPARIALRLYQEYCRMDDVSPLAMEGLTLELLAEASRWPAPVAGHRPPPWLSRVTDFLRGRFAEKFSLGDVAETAAISRDHLARAFRVHQGCTVGEYVRRLRVNFACRRLAASQAPLVEIALEAGFSDQSHLTKTFKRHTGVTPADFRESCRPRKSGTTA
jgi:AraC family transcriptional regulator